jgi:hypothetical protein
MFPRGNATSSLLRVNNIITGQSYMLSTIDLFEILMWMFIVLIPFVFFTRRPRAASGARPFRVIGTNPDIDNVREDIWEMGGTYVFPPAGGIQMRVVSSSASDTVGQVGAIKVHIHYLDAAGAEKSEKITMTGITPVNTYEFAKKYNKKAAHAS